MQRVWFIALQQTVCLIAHYYWTDKGREHSSLPVSKSRVTLWDRLSIHEAAATCIALWFWAIGMHLTPLRISETLYGDTLYVFYPQRNFPHLVAYSLKIIWNCCGLIRIRFSPLNHFSYSISLSHVQYLVLLPRSELETHGRQDTRLCVLCVANGWGWLAINTSRWTSTL